MRILSFLTCVLAVVPLAGVADDRFFHVNLQFTVADELKQPIDIYMKTADKADLIVANPGEGKRVIVETSQWSDDKQTLWLKFMYLNWEANQWRVVGEPAMGVRLGEYAFVQVTNVDGEIGLGVSALVHAISKQEVSAIFSNEEFCEDVSQPSGNCCRAKCTGSGSTMTCCASGGCCDCGVCCAPP